MSNEFLNDPLELDIVHMSNNNAEDYIGSEGRVNTNMFADCFDSVDESLANINTPSKSNMKGEDDEISEISGTSGDREYHRIMRASSLLSQTNFVPNRSENTLQSDLDLMTRITPQGTCSRHSIDFSTQFTT